MYRIGEVAAQLDLSPSTVRRWSDRFSDWLSEEGGNPDVLDSGRRAVRMYSDSDIEVLISIQQLKEKGMTEDEIEAHLRPVREEAGSELVPLPSSEGEIVLSTEAVEAMEMLQQAVDGQKAIISVQRAQRDLIDALFSDALALRDENNRLRKRLRMMEEEMTRIKESDWNHRLSLEERMNQLERQVTEKESRSWWRRLIGR
ncbi:MAG: MerR family transcriptional regulator [Chloroflexota bacterium]|nr:MerR family transcriptional regulator [Chloroflexota bacterium]